MNCFGLLFADVIRGCRDQRGGRPRGIGERGAIDEHGQLGYALMHDGKIQQAITVEIVGGR